MTMSPPGSSGTQANSDRAVPVLAVRNLCKSFGAVRALEGVSLEIDAGEIHAVLGENGAGKSTLVHILSGIHRPDAGAVLLGGNPVRFRSARHARRAGIGMVHQHFSLVEALTVAENLVLSLPGQTGWRYREADVAREAQALADDIGLQLAAPDEVVGALPVGTRQRLEILKALAGGGQVLILDEPTAVLAPQEVDNLLDMLRALRQQGRAIIFITHKLREAKAIADRISILRRGRLVATMPAAGVSEADLARLMVGDRPPASAADTPVVVSRDEPIALEISHLHLARKNAVALVDVNLEVRAGEIAGVAGIDGNGQRELFGVLVGTHTPTGGQVKIGGEPMPRFSPATALKAGIGHIPPDRHHEGLILEMSVGENFLLSRVLLDRLARRGVLDAEAVRKFADEQARRFDVRSAGLDAPVRSLSGGNQQRIVVARELAPRPRVLIASNPTRGLDIGAAAAVSQALRSIAREGCAVVLISTDLDEVLSLSSRVAVLSQGRLSAPMERPFDVGKLGLMMAAAGTPA